MRVLVIDVEKFEVREEQWTEGRFLEEARRVMKCSTVDLVRYGRGMDIWIDDEGLLKNPRRFTWWQRGERGATLAGNLVITGGDDGEGNTLGTDMTVEALSQMFVFVIYPEKSELAPQPGTFVYVPAPDGADPA